MILQVDLYEHYQKWCRKHSIRPFPYQEDKRAALLAGAIMSLSKPTHFEDLVEEVRISCEHLLAACQRNQQQRNYSQVYLPQIPFGSRFAPCLYAGYVGRIRTTPSSRLWRRGLFS